MATESIQKTIKKIIDQETKESTGKKSTEIKVADSQLPIISLSGITQ